MKTIKEGDLSKIIPWYMTVIYTCKKCGWEGQPEELNEVSYTNSQLDGELARVVCPTCGNNYVYADKGR